MISPIRRSRLTRTTSNMLASRIPSAMTRGPATFLMVPLLILFLLPFRESLRPKGTPPQDEAKAPADGRRPPGYSPRDTARRCRAS